jgi:hypothetical protein
MNFQNSIIACILLFFCSCGTSVRHEEEGDSLINGILLGDYARMELILRSGYPAMGRTSIQNEPAYWAITQNDSRAMAMLIKYGLDVNFDWGDQGGNLMTNAVQFGNIEIVKLLLASGAKVNRDFKNGRSPLYSSVIYSHADIELLLMERGASFNEWDKDAFKVLGLGENGK